DGIYTFTLTASGEAFTGLIEKQLGEQDLGIPGAETDIKVNNLEYVIEVEKGSNKLLGMNIMTDMSIGAGEEAGTMNIISDITMNYSNHNAVGEIVVPAEALEAAEVGLE